MSSNLIVEVCEIKEVINHENADALELSVIKGWQCVTKKGQYKVGDKIIFIPPDAILPIELADNLGVRSYLGGTNKDRVKCVRLRGEMSFGLIIPIPADKDWEVGYDCVEDLGITKYIPPVRAMSGDAAPSDPNFSKYTDIENIRNYPNIFEEGEMVVATEKIDGCFKSDQKVMLPNGEQIPISEIKIGDNILAYDEENKKFVYSKVKKVIVKNTDKEWIKLSFDNDKEIICTSNHLFLTKDRNWIKAKDLNEEDELIEFTS